MPLFLDTREKENFTIYRRCHPVGQDFFWALCNRVDQRAASPGHHGDGREAQWWFSAAEFLTDAAMTHALKPSPTVAAWLRTEVLSLIRRPVSDWVGPPFRNHSDDTEPVGHLETAHLTWGTAVVLDLAGDIFSDSERTEIETILRERGIPMCRRWLDRNHHLSHWRCVLGAGVAVAAAVLDDRAERERAVADYRLSLQIFQSDGSHGESLQYANSAAYTLMLAREALLRRDPALASRLPAEPWNRMPRWQTASLFYQKPLAGWGPQPRARSANFNDSAALFRPSGDLLLHLACREKAIRPREAGLARWLFDTLYAGHPTLGPHDRATFGFFNDWGFLTVPLLPHAAPPITPAEAGLDEIEAFSCGDVLMRDAWDGRTILAVHGGGDPLCGPGHLHGDLNSFILVHNRERLLADPGHSCYRNLTHELKGSTRTHNTCTFQTGDEEDPELQENTHSVRLLQQSRQARVSYDRESGRPGPAADRGARRLLAVRDGEIHVTGSEAGSLYDDGLISQFSRFWLLCGTHVLFVVDHIRSTRPVRTHWHWLMNNRDDFLELKCLPPDRLVARRGAAGMKMFHIGSGTLGSPEHACVHDAYSPEPADIGEGRPGSGKLVTWREAEPNTVRTVVHAIALDGYGSVAGWHLKQTGEGRFFLEGPGGRARWSVATDFEDASHASIVLSESVSSLSRTLRGADGGWTFENTRS